MSDTVQSTWRGNEIVAIVRGRSRDATARLAFQIEGQTKVNITNNGQVDTGFMRNSVYTMLPGGNAEIQHSGVLINSEGRPVERRMAQTPPLGDADAAVTVGAEYAIWQELANSFLYRAAEQVAAQAEATLVEVFRD